jgi:argininosuccinate lyase
MPFRKAHSVAGQAVAHALDEGNELHELTLQKLKTFSKLIKKDIFNLLKPESLVNRRSSAGGTSAENVRKAISKATARLDAEMERLPEFKD